MKRESEILVIFLIMISLSLFYFLINDLFRNFILTRHFALA